MRILVLIIMLLFAVDTFAQQDSYTLLEGYPFRSKAKIIKVLGQIEGKTFALMEDGEDYFVYRFNDALTLEKRLPIRSTLKNKELMLHSVQLFGDEVLMFHTFKNQKHEKFYLILQRFHYQTYERVGEPVVIAEVPYKNNKSYPEIFIRSSDNHAYLSFCIRLLSKLQVGSSMDCYLMNSAFEVLRHEKIDFGKNNEMIKVWDWDVSNEGKLLLAAGISRFSGINYSYRGQAKRSALINLYAISADTNYMEKLTFHRMFVDDVHLELLDSTRFMACIAGKFKDELYPEINGEVFNYKLQRTSAAYYPNIPLDSMLKAGKIRRYKSGKRTRKGTEMRYRIKSVDPLNDGTIAMTIEQQFSYIISDHPNASDFYSSSFRYAHILHVRLDTNTIEHKAYVIPKCQYGSSARYFSCLSKTTDSTSYFVFNNDISNLSPKRKNDCYNGGKRVIAMLYTLDDEGNMVKGKMMHLRSYGWIMVTERSYYNEVENVFYVFMRNNKQARLVKLMM